jgi:lysophospholipase L1-like esterase
MLMKKDQISTAGDQHMRQEIRMLALGDSYTIGECVPAAESWPLLFAKTMHAKGQNFAQPIVLAKTGWTTGELIEAIRRENLQKKFNLVSLCIGVNNQYRGMDPAVFSKEFEKLLLMAIDFAGGEKQYVFVLSIPDWGVSEFGVLKGKANVSQEIDAYNKLAKAICLYHKVDFINITDLSRKAKTASNLLAEDGLHYSAKMHQQWVDEVIKQRKY